MSKDMKYGLMGLWWPLPPALFTAVRENFTCLLSFLKLQTLIQLVMTISFPVSSDMTLLNIDGISSRAVKLYRLRVLISERT